MTIQFITGHDSEGVKCLQKNSCVHVRLGRMLEYATTKRKPN